MIRNFLVQNMRICGTSTARFPRGFNWDRSPSTAGLAPTSARNAIRASFCTGHRVVGVFKETASGTKNDRVERNNRAPRTVLIGRNLGLSKNAVMEIVKRRRIDLTRSD